MKTLTARFAFLSRISEWASKHTILTYLIAGISVIVIALITAFVLFYSQPTPAPIAKVQPAPKSAPAPIVYYSHLTGEKVTDEAAITAPATAIMLENSPDARPQSGLKDAGVVYEAIAEGGITRFLALYQTAKPQLVGPVRSVRMYYVDWFAPYNASIAHVGGSASALAEVRNGSYRDLDQFFNAGTYWRATDRYAPHNVYTSFEKLDMLNAAKGYTKSEFTSFPRTDGKPAEPRDATSIAINFSGPLYNTTYAYDAATNTYARSQAGAPHLDREAGQITPSVVVALRVNMSLVMEDGYREQIETSGSGEATVFQNGIATMASWHKADRSSPLTLTDQNGKDIPLVRGQTWIAAVPLTGGTVSWQ